ncbi:hypothetical protein BVG79_00509 [Ketogulonicigenium robustum]|uniref:Uncharacterized protein n=1 Tax=Ketogulonicigenium robustum TaxID=92947 RepID=A0A1W6NXE8_9RHOB|nr:hypothetical protein BVG79_00509 [Ketogulonicigenium robustum]
MHPFLWNRYARIEKRRADIARQGRSHVASRFGAWSERVTP